MPSRVVEGGKDGRSGCLYLISAVCGTTSQQHGNAAFLVCDAAGQYCSVSQAEVFGRLAAASGLGESFIHASSVERSVSEPPVTMVARGCYGKA